MRLLQYSIELNLKTRHRSRNGFDNSINFSFRITFEETGTGIEDEIFC